MPTAQQPSRAKQAAAGAAAVGTAEVGAGVAVAPPAVAAAGSGALAVATATIMATFISFLAALRERHRAWLLAELGRYSSTRDDIAEVVRQEMVLEQEFARRSADRLASSLPQALRIADPAERERKVRQLLSDEERYAAQRGEAMAARAIAALTRFDLRRSSPLGAFWRIGAATDHTEGCKFMAGWPTLAGRFWPWAVLDRVHPPRHYGCSSSLHGYGEAILAGWMTPSDVPDTRKAIRTAAGVVMEQHVADELEAELELREQLVEAGVDKVALERVPFVGVELLQEEVGHGAEASV